MSRSAEDLFLEHLGEIERIIAAICRRKLCFGDEASDFASFAKLRLIEDDYAVLRKFKGKSRLTTYLTTVVHNLFLDYRISKWGKWRPSAAARRLGTLAVRLETLVSRDGFGLDEAAEILRTSLGENVTSEELEALAGQLPPRVERRFEGEESLREVATDDAVERRIRERELEGHHERVERLLGGALRDLDGEDRRLLRLRFEEGFKVSQIARTLGVESRPLYHRFEKCLAKLRAMLEKEGLSWEQVREVVRWERSELSGVFGAGGRNRGSGSVPPEGQV